MGFAAASHGSSFRRSRFPVSATALRIESRLHWRLFASIRGLIESSMLSPESIKHLARIQYPVRIKRAAQLAHDPHLSLTSEGRQKRFLRQTNAVFARDGSAQSDG